MTPCVFGRTTMQTEVFHMRGRVVFLLLLLLLLSLHDDDNNNCYSRCYCRRRRE